MRNTHQYDQNLKIAKFVFNSSTWKLRLHIEHRLMNPKFTVQHEKKLWQLQKEVKRQCLFMFNNRESFRKKLRDSVSSRLTMAKASRRQCLVVCDNGENHSLPKERTFWGGVPSIRVTAIMVPEKKVMFFDLGVNWQRWSLKKIAKKH